MTDTSLDDPHWTFATRLYGQPGVSAACLELQDSAGVDVIVLLFMLYSVRRGALTCDAARIAEADAVVANWRAMAILPLRAIRKALKNGDATTPAEAAAELRKTVQAAEIRAEQISLGMLARDLGTGSAPGSAAPGQPLHAVIEEIARFYAAGSGRGSDVMNQRSVVEAIRKLADAVHG